MFKYFPFCIHHNAIFFRLHLITFRLKCWCTKKPAHTRQRRHRSVFVQKHIGIFSVHSFVLYRFSECNLRSAHVHCSMFLHPIPLSQPREFVTHSVCECRSVIAHCAIGQISCVQYECQVMANPLKVHTKLPIIRTHTHSYVLRRVKRMEIDQR